MSTTLTPEPVVTPPATPPADPPVTPPVAGDPPVTPPVPPVTPPPTPPPVTPPVALTDSYTLKLPDDSTADATLIERTGAIARDLGLSNEAAQKALEFVHQEAEARADAEVKSYQPGGAEWKKRVDVWKAETLADTTLGKTPEERQAALSHGDRVLREYAKKNPADEQNILDVLDKSGIAYHPAFARLIVFFGRAMGEPTELVRGGAPMSKPKTPAQQMYPDLYNEDGSPKT
jgi:hypothetical protein